MMDAKKVELAVFSGECLQGVCGIATGFFDMHDKPLFTGDIVQVYSVESWVTEHGDLLSYMPEGLTAVVSDEWTSYMDGSFVRKSGCAEFFVMGIRDVDLEEPGTWRVRKLKDFSDVVLGEHWKDYGFSYSEVPEAIRIGAPA